MKTALLITTDEKFREIPFENKLEFYYKHIDCDIIEVTHPRMLYKIGDLSNKFIMIVDEEGVLKDNPKLNVYASAFSGISLYGNVMIVKDTGKDFDGLTRKDHEKLATAIRKLLKKLETYYIN